MVQQFAVIALAGALLLAVATTENPSTKKIIFPVQELGNCVDKKACKIYCDTQEHMNACINFAERHGLIAKHEAERTKKFRSLGRGPGGCTSETACENYCNNTMHINECITFAEKYDLLPQQKLAEAKKIRGIIAQGEKLPGGCNNQNECENYCNDVTHIEECISFAERHGFIPKEELEEARKVQTALKKGAKLPGRCRGKNECETYCLNPDHMEECLEFAVAAGFIDDEGGDLQKILQVVKSGIKPPKCRGLRECEVYCTEPAHLDECLVFGEAIGLVSKEQAAMIRKTGGRGPGGCRGERECETYCRNPKNQDECSAFGQEHGFITDEDRERMEEDREQLQYTIDDADEEQINCIRNKLGQGVLEKMLTGKLQGSEQRWNIINSCTNEQRYDQYEDSE